VPYDSDAASNEAYSSDPVGSTVGVVVVADDLDRDDTVSYSLEDDFGHFAIDANTGVITTTASVAGQVGTVSALSSDGSGSRLDVTVTVVSDPVSAISDSDPADQEVNENAAAGTSVGITVLATDAEPTDTVSYSLSDDAGGRFQINAMIPLWI